MSDTPILDPVDDAGATNTTPEGNGTGEQNSAPENKEARYRRQRNEAREQLAEAESRLAQLQTTELHRLAGEILSAPEDINLAGKPLADFLTPEGWVDRAAVEAAAREVAQTRPGLAKYQPGYDPSQGHGIPGTRTAGWAALLEP
ncbi:hypothetical protein [Mycobacteroides abscessus]|uniref:Uncharacterized protein n=1 Tax=Mycobacteroides abscessus 1948 TaxID=1299323 RepID=A0A829QNZ1_9MYCO|nr:hypothetical protein [Mycobacteroides abscessus]EUA64271.1 hypothetical protein I542_4439 [Mycobacteroides abscessus 1948]EIU40886.1 hypothetical protein MA6G0125R_4659 [Mycobacteroides abscessus 6G-0125-R]EIU51080.1 hypothetical protein MA6G0125S_0393 [Mycobacteroides abscessus 6G-0125-S]EIU66594.1 hypothetical protein MA6G1108_0385 [Mycobacteroides abscessus 6G-1108]EIU99171.1 hypothetical protein MA6G0212_0454 [Mycobacteroides abscessus 6G-0212]